MHEHTNNAHRPNVVYPEISYEIIGATFEVNKELGCGYRENQYQKALEIACREKGFFCKTEEPITIEFKGEYITTNYIDLLLEKDNKRVIVEIKQGDRFGRDDIKQLYNYLCAMDIKLGILVRFTRSGVKYKRIVNIQ